MKKTKNRWLIAASAVGIHISIGSVYAYSAWKMPLENSFGWKATQTTLAFSIAIFFLGLSAAFLGKIIEKKGPRFGGFLSALLFCGGLAGASFACKLENLLLFYLTFGVISGVGLGLGYISPVSTLVKWFPDRRGLATGLAIMGFGFGGLVCARLIDVFVPGHEISLPAELSAVDYINLTETEQDQLLTSLTSEADRVLDQEGAAATLDLHKVVIFDPASIVQGFLVLAGIYFLVMLPSALYIEPPPKEYAEQFAAKSGKAVKAPPRELSAKQALKTPEFWGLWLMLFLNVSCGIAVIATAKKMGYEMVHLSVQMSSLMVMGISLLNGLGRIFWASLSDYIGRANTYIAFFFIQLLAFPLLANLTALPWAFMLVTFIILSCYGGGFACIPAYISDLFGLKEMPTVHGLILTAWSLAGLVGPMLNSAVYERTHDYRLSLYIFGGVFLVALLISLWMKGIWTRVQEG